MQSAIPDRKLNIADRKINVGCGNNKIDGYINIDISSFHHPDLVYDIREGLPFPDNCAREILCFHTIEHIEEVFHSFILQEFFRVLVPEGLLLISYPEFIKVATNYINNHLGMRDFWKKTIYGLQRAKGDYHVSLMNSDIFAELMQSVGFVDVMYAEESKEEPYNTVILGHKGSKPNTYEDLLNQNSRVIIV